MFPDSGLLHFQWAKHYFDNNHPEPCEKAGGSVERDWTKHLRILNSWFDQSGKTVDPFQPWPDQWDQKTFGRWDSRVGQWVENAGVGIAISGTWMRPHHCNLAHSARPKTVLI